MKKEKIRFRKRILFEERVLAFVIFPTIWKVDDIVEKLFWAKSWKVEDFYSKVVIRCWIKPPDWKHFIKENKERLLPFQFVKVGRIKAFQVKTEKDVISCYLYT